MIVNDLRLINILNRVQELPTKKIFAYNKMERINSKPALQAGTESLIEYSLQLQLHSNFCNPQKDIDLIEEWARSRNSFNWLYHDEYIGTFLIDSIEITSETRIQGVLIYAEININLLEDPEAVYEEENEFDLSEEEIYSENSSKLKTFAKKVKTSITENMKNAVDSIISGDALISENLSDAAKELFSSVSTSVLSDISGVNVAEIYSTASTWADRLEGTSSISPSELITITNAVRSIPDIMVSGALRGDK